MATGGTAARLNPERPTLGPGDVVPAHGRVTQVFVFEGEHYLGWDCFTQARVVIGAGHDADLRLDDPRLDGARVLVACDGDRVRVRDLEESGLLRINGDSAAEGALGPLDVLGVGPYAIKVRSKPVRGTSKRPAAPPGPAAPLRREQPAPEPSTQEPDPGHPTGLAAEALPPAPTPTPDEAPPPAEAVPAAAPEPRADLSVEPPRPPAPWSLGDDPSPLAPLEEVPAGKPGDADAAALAALDTDEILETLELLIDDVVGGGAMPARAEPEPAPAAPSGAFVASASAAPAEPAPPPPELLAPAPPPTAADAPWLHAPLEDDEAEEEGERDREASFSLAEELVPAGVGGEGERVVQVLKIRGGQVVDCRFLGPAQTYHGTAGRRRQGRPLVQTDAKLGVQLHLVRSRHAVEPEGSDPCALDDAVAFRDEHRLSRRRELYRCPLPRGSRAVVREGQVRYWVQEVAAIPESPLPPVRRDARGPVRTLLASSLFHMIVLCVGGLFVSLPSPRENEPPETRFVQIETRELETLFRKPPPPKPPEQPKPAPVAPTKVAKRAPPKSAPPPKSAVAKSPPPKAAPEAAPAPEVAKAAPDTGGAADAGGGHGGNALNRNVPNVRKAGLLGALGIPDGVSLGAGEAMAAVTNLDAVATAHAPEASLQVGGLVGKLGTGRVELPAVGLVNTKGSTQAVASAGVAGGGRVAALEKGTTGRRQVAGMVKTDLKAPVQIQGGMSREEVKRVIDQHMDEISYCYETALIEEPSIVGKMTFEWKILETGSVGEVRIQSSSIRSETLHACIKGRIRGWRFPEPRGTEVLVSYPFVFDVVGF